MTFQTYETSNDDGKPISLYEIVWGQTVWRYCGVDRNVTVAALGEQPFVPIPIKDSGMTQGGSSNNDTTVECSPDIPLADLFRSTPPSAEIKMTIYSKHVDDPEAFIRWKGYVSNVKRAEDDSFIRIIGQTYLASFERTGLRLGWTRGCPHILYDSECKVAMDDFAVAATITAMDGNSITVDTSGGHPAGWFTGGFVEWVANGDGTKDYRGIQDSPSDLRYVLLGTTYRLEVGMAVTLYPGCNLTAETCHDKFDNIANYGGCPQMTGKNVFDGTPIM